MKKSTKILLGILYWLWQLTWGALFTYVGLLVSLIVIMIGGKVTKNGFSYNVEIGHNWGGVSLGAVTITARYSGTSKNYFEHIRRHEAGHGCQAMLWGILFPFVIGLPSLIRATFHLYTDYESIWFERQATKWGTWFIDKIES